MIVDVARWGPNDWNDICGNDALIEHFQDVLRACLNGNFCGLNTLVAGPSRTGKTSLIKFFVRCLYCEQLDPGTLTPCSYECANCRTDVSRFGLQGIHVYVQQRDIHYLPIDCARVTETELRERLNDLWDYSGFRVVYLDEAHRLVRRSMDEQLLKPVEELANTMWIVTSADIGGLEEMFKKRFIRLQTQRTTIEQFSLWLSDRCREFEIDVDDPSTIIRLSERSNRVPGDALQVLARAMIKVPKLLTEQLVEKHTFKTEE